MDGLVDELRNVVSMKDSSDDYLSMNSRYVPSRLEAKNFHDIHNISLVGPSHNRILFVDGGNSILFETASLCIGLIRVAGISYFGNVRLKRESFEFYVFVNSVLGKYSVKTYPKTSFDGLIFDPDDESLCTGIERCSISKIISVLRRFAEIGFATEHSGDVDYILMDGTLEARYTMEDEYLTRLCSTGKACALSKTCSLTTKNGHAITKKLLDLNNEKNYDKNWYYNPIVENNNPMHAAKMYFARLNARSEHVFRFEIQDGFQGDVEALFSLLSSNSNDPIFLGYPYGLIDVDQYARVSDDESRFLRTKLSAKMGKDWNEFSKSLKSMDAHSILDKIKY